MKHALHKLKRSMSLLLTFSLLLSMVSFPAATFAVGGTFDNGTLTIPVNTAGKLQDNVEAALTSADTSENAVTELIVSGGKVDHFDLSYINDSLPNVAILNLTESTMQGDLANAQFANNNSLVEVYLPLGLMSVGGGDAATRDLTGEIGAFWGCQNLVKVDLNEATIIGTGAFARCPKLETVLGTENIVAIYGGAFNNAGTGDNGLGDESLVNLNFSNKLTIIGYTAFMGAHSIESLGDLSNVIFDSETGASRRSAFLYCSSLKTVNFSAGKVTYLPQQFFSGCSSLTSVGDMSTVTYVGPSAFRDCSSLSELNFSRSLTTIDGTYSFFNATSLTSLGDLSAVTTIGGGAFRSVPLINHFDFRSVTAFTDTNILMGTNAETIVFPAVTTATTYAATFGSFSNRLDLTDPDSNISNRPISGTNGAWTLTTQIPYAYLSGLDRTVVAGSYSLRDLTTLATKTGTDYLDASAWPVTSPAWYNATNVTAIRNANALNAAITGTASGSLANANATYNFATPGTYTVTVNSANASIRKAGTTSLLSAEPLVLTINVLAAPATPATGVTLSDSTRNLEVDDTFTLTSTVAPAGASITDVIWTSSNSNIVSVSNAGVVTAKAVGNATITATTVDGGFTATCAVTVNPTVATGLTLSESAKTVKQGQSFTVAPTVAPANATDKAVSWLSGDTGVATVSAASSTGAITVTATGVGSTTITAVDSNGHSQTVNVTVQAQKAEQILLNHNPNQILYLGYAKQVVIPTVLPAGTTDKDIVWTIDKPEYASFVATDVAPNAVVIQADKEGAIVTLTATAADGSGVVSTIQYLIPILDLDVNGDDVPDFNIVQRDDSGDAILDSDGNPIVSNIVNPTDPEDTNYDKDGDGKPDTNIDLDGDGTPDINIDVDGDGNPDLNIDVDGDGTPDLNIVTDGDGNLKSPVDPKTDEPDVNVVTDGQGELKRPVSKTDVPDLNLDTDADGKADTNIDTDGDLYPDKNIILTVVAGANGSVTGSGKYDAETQVTIQAKPASGYKFAGWTVITPDANGNPISTLAAGDTVSVKFADATAATTTLVMPHCVAKVQANFVKADAEKPADKDVTSPDAPTVDKPTAGDTTITGKGEPGGTVTVKVGGKTITGKIGADGKFSVKVPAVKAGQTVTVTVTDKAGNVSAATKVKVEATYGLDKPTGDYTNLAALAAALMVAVLALVALRKKEAK